MLIKELARQDRVKYSDGVLALWIVFGSSHLGEEDLQGDFDLDLFSLDLV